MRRIPDQERIGILKRLHKAGAICPITEHLAAPRIRQSLDYFDNKMFGLDQGGTGFLARVEIAVEFRLQIRQFLIEVPWGIPELDLLEDPGPGRSAVYKFPEKDRREFPRTMVLNHQTGVWSRGTVKEGIFVAYTNGPIPSKYTRGEVDVHLIIIDCWDHRYRKKLRVTAEAVVDYSQRAKRTFTREPLFGEDWRNEVKDQDAEEQDQPSSDSGRLKN